ncbi:TPA: hypothetical protein NBO33_003698 [Enterobacter hormaechei]|nr:MULTISPECIES: hypothetical protein [Enterobacter]QPX98373.1 hypothetical protein H2Z33_03285 [Enterobacter sp. YSU]SAI40416.1 Uncharacterised protein [Enterobacter hormaechei]HAS0773866.1 hypothetical protein [Enterobacter hormaechei]HCD1585452.1 hypothetical protein [Enterobacter hormaechei]HCD2651724.1 hypothetical protein [Enterobacter hormaechei]
MNKIERLKIILGVLMAGAVLPLAVFIAMFIPYMLLVKQFVGLFAR